MSCRCVAFRLACLMCPWECILLSLHCWVVASATGSRDAAGPFGWLLSDKGPFHQTQEFTEFVERYQQGFTTSRTKLVLSRISPCWWAGMLE
ncbi:BMP/retinoic acid-inducible neural-specific protein 3 [Tachysurus ichikawai]